MAGKGNISFRKVFKFLFIYIFVILAVLYSVTPILSLGIISVSKKGSLPQSLFDIHLDNLTLRFWKEVIFSENLLKPILNSTLISILVVIIVIIISVPAAYAFSRSWKYKKLQNLFYFILIFRMIPGIVLIIPIFILIVKIRLIDTIWGIILTLIPLTIPGNIWLLKGYIDNVPIELEEAAWVEGASVPRSLLSIVIPNCFSGILVVSVLMFLGAYIDYLIAVTIARSDAITLPMKIAGYFTAHSVEYQKLASATIIGMIPMIVLYSLIRKQLSAGVSIGAGFK